MTNHRITYEGPSSLAVSTATALADAEGVELTSSKTLERGEDGTVRLALTAEGSPESVTAAAARIREGLPPGATITIEGDAS